MNHCLQEFIPCSLSSYPPYTKIIYLDIRDHPQPRTKKQFYVISIVDHFFRFILYTSTPSQLAFKIEPFIATEMLDPPYLHLGSNYTQPLLMLTRSTVFYISTYSEFVADPQPPSMQIQSPYQQSEWLLLGLTLAKSFLKLSGPFVLRENLLSLSDFIQLSPNYNIPPDIKIYPCVIITDAWNDGTTQPFSFILSLFGLCGEDKSIKCKNDELA